MLALVVSAVLSSPSPASERPYRIAVLPQSHACVVLARDRSLRRVDLVTAETTAIATEHQEGDGDNTRITIVDENHLVTWDSDGDLYLRDANSLAPLATMHLPPPARIAKVTPDGSRVAFWDVNGVLSLRPFDDPTKTLSTHVLSQDRGAVQSRTLEFSPDSAEMVVIVEERIHVYDLDAGELLAELDVGDTSQVDKLGFYGTEYLLVGWSIEDDSLRKEFESGVDVIRLSTHERVARLEPTQWPWGGRVSSLRGDPDLGSVTCALGSSGAVLSFLFEDSSERWMVDVVGGYPFGVRVTRDPSSQRFYLWGGQTKCVMDANTGRVLAQADAWGNSLQGTSDDRFVVFESGNDLHVLDGRTFEQLYVRVEGLDGVAWIEQGGERRELAPPSTTQESPVSQD